MAIKDAEKRRMDPAHLRDLDDEELQEELKRLLDAQFRLKFRSATEDATGGNPMQFRMIRRNIARMKTVLRERNQS